MTAEPRDVEEIRGDIARVPRPGEQLPDRSLHGWIGIACRLRDDADALLARLAAADRENAELRGEVERLGESQFAVGQALVNEQLRSERAESQLAAAQAQLAEVASLLMARSDSASLIEGLEKVRRRLCHYGPDASTCDCKYGASFKGEQSGCPELRRAIAALSAAPQPEPDPVVSEPAASWHVAPDTPDLMAALRASVEAAKKQRAASDEPARCHNCVPEGCSECRPECRHCNGSGRWWAVSDSTGTPRGPIMPPEFNSTSAPRIGVPQRQDSLTDQLRSLIEMANRGGMYDAADYLREVVERAEGRIASAVPGHLTTKTLSEVLGLTPEQEAERVAGLNEALSRISDMERGR